jgi:hypothetical protein
MAGVVKFDEFNWAGMTIGKGHGLAAKSQLVF